jgi:hypothetical protein
VSLAAAAFGVAGVEEVAGEIEGESRVDGGEANDQGGAVEGGEFHDERVVDLRAVGAGHGRRPGGRGSIALRGVRA